MNTYKASMIDIKGAYGNISKFTIRGSVVGVYDDGKNDKYDVKIDDTRTAQLVLKRPATFSKGQDVQIDKRDIKSMKIKTKDEINMEKQIRNAKNDEYTGILEKMGVEASRDNIESLKALQDNGLEISSSNINSYTFMRKGMDKIFENMDYEKAVKLVEKNMNIEEESIQKVVDELENTSGSQIGEKGQGQTISTDEAEDIARDLYGSKMGKDITDVIKELKKQGYEPTRESVDKIHDLFSKISDIKDIKGSDISNLMKNNLEPTIENLYNAKNYIKEGTIRSVGNVALRGASSQKPLDDAQLKRLEPSISKAIKEAGFEDNDENMRIAKEFIKKGVELNRENLESYHAIKQDLSYVAESLDYEKTSILYGNGLEVESMDISKLRDEIENIEYRKQESIVDDAKVSQILKEVENTREIDQSKIVDLIKSKSTASIQNLIGVNVVKLSSLEMDAITSMQYENVINATTIMEQLQNLNFDSIAFTMKNNMPMTIKNLAVSVSMLTQTNADVYRDEIAKLKEIEMPKRMDEMQQKQIRARGRGFEAIKALVENGLAANRGNIKRLYEVKEYVDNIRRNISIKEASDGIENIRIEDLQEKNPGNMAYDPKSIMRTIEAMKQNRDGIFGILIRNKMDINLKNIRLASSYLNGSEGIGKEIGSLMSLKDEISVFGNESLDENLHEIRKDLSNIQNRMKEKGFGHQNLKDKLEEAIDKVEEESEKLPSGIQQEIGEKSRSIKENLNFQRQMNKEENTFNLPYYADGIFKDLHVYINERKQKGKSLDPENTNLLISIDTKNMGSIGIILDIDSGGVNVRFKTETKGDENRLIDNIDQMKDMIGQIGYRLKNASGSDQVQKEERNANIGKGLFDIKI